MSRTYSSFVLICVVTQVLTDLPEGLCQRKMRKYQQVTKISSRPYATKTRYCPSIQLDYCSYHIRYYKCTYLQYLKVAKVKLTYTCCDGYYFRKEKCEKEVLNATLGTTCYTCLCNDTCTNDTGNVISNTPVPTEANKNEASSCPARHLVHAPIDFLACNDTCTNDTTSVTDNFPVPIEAKKVEEAVNAIPGTTCNTCLCNDTCTNDTTSVTDNLPVPTEANKDEDTNWDTGVYTEGSEMKTTTSIDFSSTHAGGNHTEGESRDTSMIVAVLLAVLVLTIVAVIICWKVRHHGKQENKSLEEIEPQPPRNIPWDQNAAHEIEDTELRDESGIYFFLEPRDDQTAYENIDDEFPHDAESTRNPYDTVDRRNRYSSKADPREDVDEQGVQGSRYESDIYHHLNRSQKETYNTDVYGILSGVELSQIQL